MKYRKSGAVLPPAVTPESLQTRQVTRLDRHKGGRHYQVDGEAVAFPSVTTILGVINKPALVVWAKNVALESVRNSLMEQAGEKVLLTADWVGDMLADAKARPDEVKTEAADFGTEAHGYIERLLKGKPLDIPEAFVPVMDNFLEWQNEYRLNITLSETMVYSLEHQYAGSMDAIATRRGKLVALDWKTSNGLYREYDFQVAAYAQALSEMTGQPVKEAWVVRFGKKVAEFECRKVSDLDMCFAGFKGAMDLWRAIHSDPHPRWRK